MNNFYQHSKNYFFDIKIKQPKFNELYSKYKILIKEGSSINEKKEIDLEDNKIQNKVENNEIQDKIIEFLLSYIVAPILVVLFIFGILFKNFFNAVMKDVYSRIVGFVASLIFIAILYLVFNFLKN